jgi:hypothetical protein
MATNGAIVAILAAQAQAERRAFEAFRLAGATAPDRAQTLKAMDITESMALRALTNRGIVCETEPGHFWLDERKLAARSRAGRPAMLFGIIVLLAVMLMAVAVGMNLR